VLPHLKMVLKRDAAQQAAFDAFTAAQQDPQSSLYHQWLTPEEVGSRFGASQQDLNQVSSWLRSQGFHIEDISPGGWVIGFSGTVAQVQSALHTEIHFFDVNGERHYANVSAPRIPQALGPVVSSVFPLHNFRKVPASPRVTRPNLLQGSSHVVAPSDFATIYDLGPVYSTGIDGTGQAIAIVSQCPIKTSYVDTFRSNSGLPANTPTVQIVNEPACFSGDAVESYLDVEWAGAVAKGAKVLLVADDVIDDSALYIVQHNIAPIVSVSYGICETDAAAIGEDKYWNLLWQQAASQGMTVLVSSGDAGPAGCTDPHKFTLASGTNQVNAICSTTYTTCVGGTQFNDTANPSQSWSAGGSALGYIAEVVWNESGTVTGGSGIWASAGGYSKLYSTPTWQTGNTNALRGVPDVALNAAAHDGYYDVDEQCGVCIASGTSASAPSFAGIMALVVQKTGQRQGNVNPLLYSLASTTGVFHDVVSGNNNVPGINGYSAVAGWDPVTGLGSVDAKVLLANWPATPSSTRKPSNAVTLSYAVVTKTPPPGNACPFNAPSSTNSFQSSDNVAYLYFLATESTTDLMSDEWIAPDGSVYQNTWWPQGQGIYCFIGETLNLRALTTAQSGNWKVIIYDNGTPVSTISFLITVQGPPASVIPQSGWWWDPNLSGMGFFIEHGGQSGSGLFMAGFFSDSSGNPTWLVSLGSMSGSSYSGTWLRSTGGQSLLGPYQSPTLLGAGTVSITFSDPSHAVLTRPDGSQVNIQRYGFSAGSVVAPELGTSQVGWWWGGSALSGSGYAIEFQGTSVFIAAYVYDNSGNPIWYLATGSLASPTQYTGTWDAYAGGPQLTSAEGPYPSHKTGSPSPLTLNFTDATHGTLTMGAISIPITRYSSF